MHHCSPGPGHPAQHYNRLSLLTEQQAGGTADSFVERHYLYDKAFNPIQIDDNRWGQSHRWNSDNRLTDLYTPDNDHWRYEYDAFGRRMRKFNFSRSNNHDTSYGHSEKHVVGEEYLWSGEQLLEAAPIYADGTVAFEHATRWSYAPGGITPLAQQQGDTPCVRRHRPPWHTSAMLPRQVLMNRSAE